MKRACAPLLALGAWGCTGAIDGQGVVAGSERPAASPSGPAPSAPSRGGTEGPVASPPPGGATDAGKPPLAACTLPGPSPLRRLTRFEYDNTVRDLLGPGAGSPADEFPAEEEVAGFTTDAEALGVSAVLAERYVAAAESLAARAVADLPALLGCDPAKQGEEPCARAFIARFGRRALRRPLTDAEAARYLGLYTAARARLDFAAAIEATTQAFLLSSHFLYRVERGVPQPGGRVARVTGYELASRLSYLLWGTMPDEPLFAAAAGRLDTADGVTAEARRLLADRRARAVTRQFAEQWLHLDDVRALRKDAAVFPTFDATIGTLLAEESARSFDAIVWDGAGSLTALLTAPQSVRDAKLARFYGEGAVAGDFQLVALDPARRAGLLTHGSFLASHAKPNDSSPILRGTFVRKRILCEPLPDPPDDAVIVPPVPDPRLTTRERFAQHARDPACSGCHQLIDPVGFGFESYDGAGRYRATESGRPVDASGFLHGTDVPGAFTGAVALANKLGSSAQVRGCFMRSYFRFVYGRAPTDDDQCTLAQLEAAFAPGGGDVRALLLALTQTPAFLFRTNP